MSAARWARTRRAGDTIELAELPFNDQFATEMNQQLDQQSKRDFWWKLARNSAYPALGLVAFLILLRTFKQTPVQEIPLGVPVGRHGGHGNGKAMAMATAIRALAITVLSRSRAWSRWMC